MNNDKVTVVKVPNLIVHGSEVCIAAKKYWFDAIAIAWESERVKPTLAGLTPLLNYPKSEGGHQ